MEERSN